MSINNENKKKEGRINELEQRIIYTTKSEEGDKQNRRKEMVYTGRILHLDGDKKYSEKSMMYYKKMGLNATVKNIPENKQPKVVYRLLQIHNPDILVITRTSSEMLYRKNIE